jgi:arylsulfatase A-like enzyme
MKRCLLAVAACLAGLAMTGFSSPAKPRAPNVIVILTDDLGYGDLGAYGGKVIDTPNIDALAASGVRFTDGYATAAVCAPSRAGLISGRHQARFGFEFNPVGRDEQTGVPVTEHSIAQVMKSAGYATAMVGKWHIGQAPGFHPLDRGFDSFFGFLGGAASYFKDPAESGLQADTGADGAMTRARFPMVRGRTVVEQGGYLTDVFTDEAIGFIKSHRRQPFFLYLAYNAPHTPLQAPKAYTDRYAHIASPHQRLYAAMVASLDDNIGRLRKALADEGLERDTVVFFLSDNGCPNYIRGACSNGPLAGYKAFPWEGGVRVPFLISAPGRIAPGLVSSHPVSTLDILPTVAHLAGVKAPTGVEGRDIASALAPTAKPVERTLYWRMGPNHAVREGTWKLLVVNKSDTVDDMANVLGSPTPDGVKAQVSPLGQWTLLFDVSEDPGEKHDLASAHPEVVARLSKDFAAWDKANVEPMFTSRRQFRSEVDGRKVQLFN